MDYCNVDVAVGPRKKKWRTLLEWQTGQRGKVSLTPNVPLPDLRVFAENPVLPSFFCVTTVSTIHGYSQIHGEFNWFVAFPTADDEVVLWLLKGEGNLISMQRWDEMQHSVNWQMEILLQNSLFDVEDNGENLNLWKSAVGQNTIRPLKS